MERNKVRAARVFPLPLLRLWITPLRQLPTAAAPPHHSRDGERREKSFEVYNSRPFATRTVYNFEQLLV